MIFYLDTSFIDAITIGSSASFPYRMDTLLYFRVRVRETGSSDDAAVPFEGTHGFSANLPGDPSGA